MEPLKKDKREGASFVPYRRIEGWYEFFLQKRDTHVKVHAGLFSVFGGGLEPGEDAKTGFMREIKEELVYTPLNSTFFDRYESHIAILHVFIEEVGRNFENLIHVQEGEYGKFLAAEEVAQSEHVAPIAKLIVEEMMVALKK